MVRRNSGRDLVSFTQTCFTSRKTSIFAFRVVNADRISSLHSSIAHHSNVPPSRVNSTSFLCFARERRQTKTLIARTMSTHWRELLLLRRSLTFDCMSDVANDDGQEGSSAVKLKRLFPPGTFLPSSRPSFRSSKECLVDTSKPRTVGSSPAVRDPGTRTLYFSVSQ